MITNPMQQSQIKSLNKIKLFWINKDAAEDEKYLEEFYKGMANEEPKTNSSPLVKLHSPHIKQPPSQVKKTFTTPPTNMKEAAKCSAKITGRQLPILPVQVCKCCEKG